MLMRSITAADDRTRPLENLATNPRFKRAVAGTGFTRRNLATNPRFRKAVAGSTVVRRNLSRAPLGGGSFQWFAMNGDGASTIARPTTGGPDGKGYAEITWTSVGTTGNRGIGCGPTSDIGDFTPGKVYSFSVMVRASQEVKLYLNIDWKDAAGAYLSLAISNTVTVKPGEWTRLVVNGAKMPMNAVRVQPFIRMHASSLAPVGLQIAGTQMLMEERPSILPYFDGSTTDDTGIVYEWEGTPNASPSVAKAAVVEVRRNLSPNPGSEVTALSAEGGGSAAIARSTLRARSGTYSTRCEWISGSRGVSLTANASLAANTTYTVSAWVYWESGEKPIFVARNNTYTATGITISQSKDRPSVMGQWERIYFTVTRTEEAGGIRVFNTVSASSVYFVDEVLIEATPVLGDYFDGTNTPDADLMPAWTGTPNASASVLYATRSNADSANVSPVGSIAPARHVDATGKTWLRAIPLDTGADSGIRLVGSTSSLGGLVPGRTYTIQATLKLTAPQTGTQHARARRISYTDNVLTWPNTVLSPAAPNAAGETRLSLTFTVSPGAEWATIRLYNGAAQGGGDAYWTDVVLTEGAYTGPFFDGDTDPDNSGIAYSWDGTPHASTSKMQAAAVEVRRNYIAVPLVSQAFGGWTAGSGVSQTADVDGRRLTAASVGSGAAAMYRQDTSAVAAAPGEVWSTSFRVRNNGAAPITMRAYLAFAGAPTSDSATHVTIEPGAIGTLVHSAQIPKDATAVRPGIRNIAAATDFDITVLDGMLLEKAPAPGAPFTGSSGSPDGDLVAEWVGAENASASVLRGIGVDTTSTANGPAYLGANGGLVLANPRGQETARSAIAALVTPGATYTVIALIASPVAQLPSRAANIKENGGAWRVLGKVHAASATLPAGQSEHRVTITTPMDVANQQIVVEPAASASPANPLVWLRMAVIPGIYTGPMLDGDDPRVVWRGTPHASTSVGYPPLT